MSVTSVTSESLQKKLRDLLPSQKGFGTDISASDTIIPVIDLTAAAEGSEVRADLQTALAFGSQTAFDVQNGSTTVINTTGFWRIVGGATLDVQTNPEEIAIDMTDGATTKVVWAMRNPANGGADVPVALNVDFTLFVAAGESVIVRSGSAECVMIGSVRQLADINGTLVQPVGFNPS